MTHLRFSRFVFLMGGLAFLVSACQSEIDGTSMSTRSDSVSYAVGMDIAKAHQKQEVSLNPALLYEGYRDMMAGSGERLSVEEALEVIGAFQQEANQQAEQKMRQAVVENEILGKKFMEKNAENSAVVTTPTGLQYEILTAGTGAKPNMQSVVQLHFKGSLIDGTVFQDTYSTGEVIQVTVGELIPGWAEALTLMPVGSQWKVVIPESLAFGQEGRAPSIPPNSTLVYEISLLSIIE
ncbi:FKBP-type peptidyl-prolyl cis-trans isomerase [Pontibacter sp. G13]|uniref:FKBP-type peptidyl-prolyl cis-trans isomerase n=1 Tax=Pontibacter sp. G13 TaxID=3074898 RepID=UPI002889D2D3|nr:FKBP-type peptidyl-prolyl cis-trans isomerase [Pontibacter sp. G13]WNJ21464.1 FKBP-type peptidyl-prolyl cis-trans isomerase [Pontibacter sp. G13]